MSVINLRAFANAADVPVLLLVDMQQEYIASPRLLAIPNIDVALSHCKQALHHARQIGLPVAFTRRIGNSAFFNRATPFARWIEGFEPERHEMIFDHAQPSCYTSEPFIAFMSDNAAGFVMAGFAGESACLSTMIDAHHRRHKATFLRDASASHDLDDLNAADAHRAVGKICGLYGDVVETATWIAAMQPHSVSSHRA